MYSTGVYGESASWKVDTEADPLDYVIPTGAALDYKELMQSEWKLLAPKQLPKRLPPPSTGKGLILPMDDVEDDSPPWQPWRRRKREGQESQRLARQAAAAQEIGVGAHSSTETAPATKSKWQTLASQASTAYTEAPLLSDGSGDENLLTQSSWVPMPSLPSTAGLPILPCTACGKVRRLVDSSDMSVEPAGPNLASTVTGSCLEQSLPNFRLPACPQSGMLQERRFGKHGKKKVVCSSGRTVKGAFRSEAYCTASLF